MTQQVDDLFAGRTLTVGDVFTEQDLDAFRMLMTGLNAAKRVIALADDALMAGEGVGLRYYFYDTPLEHDEFEAALQAADVKLKSDEPPPERRS